MLASHLHNEDEEKTSYNMKTCQTALNLCERELEVVIPPPLSVRANVAQLQLILYQATLYTNILARANCDFQQLNLISELINADILEF